jgi:Lrp/AsnC family leucine-responsive transcriptional regulator
MLKTLHHKVIDEISVAILQELCENSRTSTAEIGRRVGLTAPAVAERISKLEDAGYIKGYHAVIDLDKLGLTIQSFVSFKCTRKHHNMMELVSTIPEVMEWYTITGQSSMLLKIVTGSREQLAKVISRLEEFGETNTSLILEGHAEQNMLRKVL